ncbi:MAG TPA: hypothetical protein PK256_19990 [Verrucomicrobiota bacterium]|nr:hypothetical protein [Verrucomicrobiota bacterium]
MKIPLGGLGEVELTQILSSSTDTYLYYTNHPGVVVKVYDLDCGKSDEISYGPYADFGLELANFEYVLGREALASHLPAFYGANIDYTAKYAYIAMEHLDGQNLKSWCESARAAECPEDWMDAFREAVDQSLLILQRFHQHGILLMDFKPENVIRTDSCRIRFVDLGAWLTPKFAAALGDYVYSATPDNAEVLIDAANIQTGIAPTPASDIFSVGVALYEMGTGHSRLALDGGWASQVLEHREICGFRDSQIRTMWNAYPHLKEALPLLETQVRQRWVLFADFWPLLKSFLSLNMEGWDGQTREQQERVLMETGTQWIRDRMAPSLRWLATPIAQATALRSQRLKSIAELRALTGRPVLLDVQNDLLEHNGLVLFLKDMEHPVEFVRALNSWQVKFHRYMGHWTIGAPAAGTYAEDTSRLLFLKEIHRDEEGHRFYQVVGDLEADDVDNDKLTLWHLRDDHGAWIGG